MKLLVGTNNEGKFIEIGEALGHLPIELVRPKDLDLHLDVEETGTTFMENAVLKAKHYYDLGGLPTVADDSGIIIEALQHELGVATRRWGAGPTATDEQWIEYFLKRMKEEENKNARFVCTLAYIDAEGDMHTFEGTCEGVITDELEADYLLGLPISACFRPEGHEAVFSALSIEQKNSTSHRGRAVKQFADFLSIN